MNGNDFIYTVMAVSFIGMIIFYHVRVRQLEKENDISTK